MSDAAPGGVSQMPVPAMPLVGVQIGATSFRDEGVGRVLDVVGERAAANAVLVATPTWSSATGGRAPVGYADHGAQEDQPGWLGGNYATVHPEYYRDSRLGPVGRAADYDTWDVFDAVIPAASERGMKTYALMDESSGAHELRRYPSFLKCLEVDIWNKPARRPCYNHPDYRNWHLSIVEDYIKSYALDGLCWRASRSGPLHLLAEGPAAQGLGLVSCFCVHCREKALDRGIDWRRAQTGFRRLVLWNADVATGQRPVDGAFVTFWRLLLEFPEILAWQSLWVDGLHQLYRDIFGTVRAYRPQMVVGWEIDQNLTFSPFDRAGQNFADLSHICDFLKIGTYNASGGPALASWVHNLARTVFADATPEQVYPVLLAMMGLDEAPLSDLGDTGLSVDYVRSETARAVIANEGRCGIWSGIDVDIPAAVHGRPGSQSSMSYPDQVTGAVTAALEAGAGGVVLGRKYAEMSLENLSAAGTAVRRAVRSP